jgi:hypothetical protein
MDSDLRSLHILIQNGFTTAAWHADTRDEDVSEIQYEKLLHEFKVSTPGSAELSMQGRYLSSIA